MRFASKRDTDETKGEEPEAEKPEENPGGEPDRFPNRSDGDDRDVQKVTGKYFFGLYTQFNKSI